MAIETLSELDTVEIVPGYVASFLHSEHMTMASWKISADAELPEHFHPHEQISIVIEGEFELTIEGVAETLRPGVVAMIPSEAKHSGRALTDCRIFDIFHPVREDYR